MPSPGCNGSTESTLSQLFLPSQQSVPGTVRPTQAVVSVSSLFVSEPSLLLGRDGSGLPRVGFELTIHGS